MGNFRGLKSKSGYFLGFSKKISDEHAYHVNIKSARGVLSEQVPATPAIFLSDSLPRAKMMVEFPRVRLNFPKLEETAP